MNRKIICLFCFSLLMNYSIFSQSVINLSGKWAVSLDSVNYTKIAQLPGSADEAKLGNAHIAGENLYTGESETWQFASRNALIAPIRYKKKINIPNSWLTKRVYLSLERCMWQTKLWINNTYVGEQHSLCTPQVFDITEMVYKGENTIVMQIDNRSYVYLGSWSHGYSPGMQSIWNGAIGNLNLFVKDDVSISAVQCYPSFKHNSLQVKTVINSKKGKKRTVRISYTLIDKFKNKVLSYNQNFRTETFSDTLIKTFKLKTPVLPWDEFTPNLYTMCVELQAKKLNDIIKVQFGFCDFEAIENRFVVNGQKIFMRGEHDGGMFPLTGYPSMNKEDWLHIFKIGKRYGLNHWRFHSWCPPEAAFDAADIIGIYLQPELPLFSQKFENTLIGKDLSRDEFLFDELIRILDTYGNHPSFVFMCMGNELKGDSTILKKWVAYGKKHDSRHLYSSSANLEAMGRYKSLTGDQYQVAHAARIDGKRFERRMCKYYNSQKPNTEKDYSHTLIKPFQNVPIISHELGQWSFYPDFREIEKYKGIWWPRNLEIFKDCLKKKGMFSQAHDFLIASGKLSSILYKEEMERALRTPHLGGFQILDLRDYAAQGSALVGLLNSFWENKGIITEKEFRQSCDTVTVLLKMRQRVWENNEKFQGEIVIPNYSRGQLDDTKVQWEAVTKEGKIVSFGTTKTKTLLQGEVNKMGEISFPLQSFYRSNMVRINLSIPERNITNSYEIWVYPKYNDDEIHPKDIIIAHEATPELYKELEAGAKVLLVPSKFEDGERMTFTTPFWSTLLFDYQPKTMGLWCNPQHLLFQDFPTESWSNWQWWELTNNTTVARLNNLPRKYRPIVQIVDHAIRNDKLGAVMETKVGKGKLLICTFDILSKLKERPVARQLKRSIVNYMQSEEFKPENIEGLTDVFFPKNKKRWWKNILVDYNNKRYPVKAAFNSDKDDFWKISSGETTKVMIELPEKRYIKGCQFEKMTGYISNIRIYVSMDRKEKGNCIIEGKGSEGKILEAKSWDNGFTIQKGKKGCFIFIEIKNNSVPVKLHELKFIFGD